MQKLQKRMIAITIAGILAVALVLSTLALAAFGLRMRSDTSRILTLESEKNVEKLNSILLSAEQSLDVLKIAVDAEIQSTDAVTNDDRREIVTETIATTALYQAENTRDATAIYLRFNPELAPSTSGFFITELSDQEGFQSVTPTDITAYAKDDDEHVAWWYRTIEAGKPSWIRSYMNENNGINMISYTMPIYVADDFIGVIGIDLRMDQIKAVSQDIKVFESGYAMLLEDGMILDPAEVKDTLSPSVINALEKSGVETEYEYKIGKTAMRLISAPLRNGMILAITAPKKEINAEMRRFLRDAVIASLLVMLAAGLAVTRLGKIVFTQYKNETNAKQAIIASLSSIYFTALEIDIFTGDIRPLRIPDFLRSRFKIEGLVYEEALDKFLQTCVSDASKENVREFMDFNKLRTRLEEKGFMQLEYMGLTRGWCRITIVPEIMDEDGAIRKIVFAVANINEEKEREKKISFKAEHDALTGLLNRTAFTRITGTLVDDTEPMGLMILDVDHFKSINDSYGHAVGDGALQKVSRLLKDTFRSTDEIIRYGGDEFVLLLHGSSEESYERFETLVGRINDLLSEDAGDGIPPLSVSAGVAWAKDGYSQELFKHADEALYRTKMKGRRGCSRYAL